VEHPPGPGERPDDGQAVPVGLPVVDNYWQVQALGQGELGPEYLLLQVVGDLFPVVVLRQLDGGAAALQVTGGAEHQPHPALGQGG